MNAVKCKAPKAASLWRSEPWNGWVGEVQSTKDKVFDEVNRETDGQVKCKAPKAASLWRSEPLAGGQESASIAIESTKD